MSQGLVYFNGVNFLGGEMTLSRGVTPSICTLRTTPQESFDRITGTLQFIQDTTVVSFPQAAVVENSTRYWHGRDGWRWTVQVADRRWMWRYYYIDGQYNERALNGEIKSWNKKSASQLVGILLDAMGETGYDIADVPGNVYPPVKWYRARAAHELQWLCDLLGMVVVLKLNNKVAIKKLNDTGGGSLPSNLYVSPIQQNWKSAVIPENLRVQGDPTIIQSKLTLSPVGRDSDGSIVDGIDTLAYSTNWANEWNTIFDGVSEMDRHHAFDTIYRWYAPDGGWDGDGVTIDSYQQLELLETLAECGENSELGLAPHAPQVTGVFWPYCDKQHNTASSAIYTGKFRVLKDLGIIEFAYPVIKWDNGLPAPADLNITIAYRVRKPDEDGYSCYTKDKEVSAHQLDNGYRILHHPELTKVKIVDSAFGAGASDNETALDAEADVYLDRTEANYDFTESRDIVYNSIRTINPDGAISQVRWWCGNGRVAMTRAGRNTEFDIYTANVQQRRAQERLAQMAERSCL